MVDESRQKVPNSRVKRKPSRLKRAKAHGDIENRVKRIRRGAFVMTFTLTSVAVIKGRTPDDGNWIDVVFEVLLGGTINGLIVAFVAGAIAGWGKDD